ncbi:MAG TPA: hypothetical protein PKM88_13560 [bacterium]|nr:hypothetical protein [bacterium]
MKKALMIAAAVLTLGLSAAYATSSAPDNCCCGDACACATQTSCCCSCSK